MALEPLVLVNLLKTQPASQGALVDLLKENIQSVVSTLPGWRASRLIAGRDGESVIIYSEWDSPEAVAAMREEPRMLAYFPKIKELATFDSAVGEAIFSKDREELRADTGELGSA